MKKDNSLKLILFTSLIVISGFIIAIIVNFSSYSGVIKDNIRNITKLSAMNIYSKISNELTKPIFVSLTMANDSFVKDWINNEKTRDKQLIIDYLDGIKKKYGYSSSFLISHTSKKYYHCDGVLKTISTEDAHDVWYYNLINKNVDYDIDIDTDQANDNNLSVFINCKIFNNKNKLLGVTGVGLEMSQVQEILNYYNKTLNVESFLIDTKGLIQIHNDEKIIEQINFFEKPGYKDYKEKILNNKEEFVLITSNNDNIEFYLTSKYIKELDWYLISLKDTSPLLKFFHKQIKIDFFVICIVIFLAILLSIKNIHYYQKKLSHMALTDNLTGLKNRRAINILFDEELDNYNKSTPTSLFMLDIDDFKNINDTYGHLTGDKVLQRVAKITLDFIGKDNSLARWGGDEFLGILHYDIEKALETLESLTNKIKNDPFLSNYNVTISIGITEANNGLNKEELISKADYALYEAKNNGKNMIKTN